MDLNLNKESLSILEKASSTFCFFLFSVCFTYAQQTGKWGDQGDGTYRNPILSADYSDPDPIRVGEDYYLVCSTFESYPGVSILHSKDLVNWRTIGAALTDLESVDSAFSTGQMNRYNGGAYAPTISYHNNKFYIYVNLYTDGFYVATSDKPEGPWKSQFLKDKNGKELRVTNWSDPCPFWDDDGKAYLISSHPGSKYWYSYIFEMSEDGTSLLDADSFHMQQKGILYQYPKGGTVISPYHSSEGNRIFKRNGYYYFQHIEFTNSGLGEGTYIFRSKNIYGTLKDGNPGSPGNPGSFEMFKIDAVLSRDNLRIPGQGGYVETPDGRWFWIAQFTKDGADGRTPNLLPVTWIKDWPVIGTDPDAKQGNMAWHLKKPIAGGTIGFPQGSDQFKGDSLDIKWMWNHQPRFDKWSLNQRKGWLRLYAFPSAGGGGFFKAGNTINQRHMRSEATQVTVKIDASCMEAGQKAGLAYFNGGKQYSFIGIEKGEHDWNWTAEQNGQAIKGKSLRKVKNIYLRSFADTDDLVVFQYSLDGKKFNSFGDNYLMKSGNFRGTMVGVFTYNDSGEKGFIDVDWFDYKIKNN